MYRLKSLLAPPVFKDEEKTHQAYLLHVILLTLISIPIPFVIYLLIKRPEEANRALTIIIASEIINITLFALLKRGYVRQTAILHIAIIWLIFLISSAASSGIYGVAYMLGNGLVITIAGILLGGRAALIMTLLAIGEGGVMVYAELQGWVPPDILDDAVSTWVVIVVLFIIVASLQNIAAREFRTALNRARASEERYRSISQITSDYTFSTKLNSNGSMHLNWVAGAFEVMTGYTYDEYVAHGGWLAHLYPDDIEKDAQALAKLKANQKVVHDIRVYTKTWEVQWVRVYAQPDWNEEQNRLVGIAGAVQNITEQKQAEEALRESEAIYRQAIEVAGAVPYRQTFDEQGGIIYDFMGEGIRQITGYGPEEFNDDLWDSMVLERQLLEDLAPYSLDEAIQQVRTGKNPIWKCEHRIRARDGKIRWVFEAAVDLRDEDGIAYGSVGMYQDITERKESQEYLQRIFLQQSAILNNIPDMAWLKDKNSRYIAVNEQFAKIAGMKIAEILGKSDFEIWQTSYAANYSQDDLEVIQSGQRKHVEEFQVDSTSRKYWVETTKTPIMDEQGEVIGTTGIARDISDRKRVELSEQQRREMLEKIIILGQHVAETQDLRTTLQRIWQTVRRDLKFDRLGIYLYDPERNAMDGTYGTNNQGEMVEEWDAHILLSNETVETISFIEALQNPYGLYLTHDYEIERNIPAGNIMSDVKDYAAVAARTGDKPVAVICVDNVISKRSFTDEQLEALRLFAGYAGLAIENARLNDSLQKELKQQQQAEEREAQRRAMLEKVVNLGKRVTEATELQMTLERIWHGVHDDLGFDRLAIFLYNPERNSFDGTLGTDMQGQIVEEWDQWYPLSELAIFNKLLEHPDGLYFTHNYDVENDFSEDNEMYGVKEYAAVAAWAGDKPIAVICVDNLMTQRLIDNDHLEALRLFSGYAGLAIENTRLNAALQSELTQQKEIEEREVHRRLMLEKVVQLGKQVTEVTDLKTTLERIWHGVHDELEFDRLAIFLYDQESHSVKGTLGTNNQGQIVEEWDYSRSLYTEKPTSFTRALGQPDGVYFTRNFAAEFNIPKEHEMYNVKDFAAVTAWGGDKPVAIITVDNFPSQRPITKEQLEALRLFAGYAGLAIENARLNMALEDDLNRRKTLIEELETKNAELERFTYTVSHDLKSPLVTITGFLGYLEQDALAGNTERIKNNINRISNAARKMQALLNDLLELSRIGRLMNSPEDIPFNEIVHEAVDRVHGQLDEINATIEIQRDLPVVNGDRIRLVEVVQNLIDNAAKYANPAARARIEIGTKTDEHNSIVFYVRDNGIGIAPKYHENIFGLFNKLNATSEGTGIGLTLVKRIIEVHGGQIWVESDTGQGATFYFTLPTR